MSDQPQNCQLCNERLEATYVDGKTIVGPWAIMCLSCHRLYGVGKGTGKASLHRLSDGAKLHWPREAREGRAS